MRNCKEKEVCSECPSITIAETKYLVKVDGQEWTFHYFADGRISCPNKDGARMLHFERSKKELVLSFSKALNIFLVEIGRAEGQPLVSKPCKQGPTTN